jgi:hypothetical protein
MMSKFPLPVVVIQLDCWYYENKTHACVSITASAPGNKIGEKKHFCDAYMYSQLIRRWRQTDTFIPPVQKQPK